MTEAQWLACADLRLLFAFLEGKASDRKLRLFAVACCRRVPGYLECEPDRQGLELTERDVDGCAHQEDFDRLPADIFDTRWYRRDAGDAINRAVETYWTSVWDTRNLSQVGEQEQSRAREQVDAALAVLLREIIGNPFRPVTVRPAVLAWNDGTVRKIAQAVYDERAFDRLPILADALEDAGCDNEELLRHCRSAGPHVRGCWAVDLLLGKG